MRARCHCGALEGWARDPRLPVNYDPELNEYSLLHDSYDGQPSSMSIYFCPACGGRAPLSHRGDLHTNPSFREVNVISRRMGSAKTIEEIVAVLGEPDVRYGPSAMSAERKEVYGLRDTKQQLIYQHLGRTVELIVQEYEDGKVGIMFSGKRKLRRTIIDRLKRLARRSWDVFR